MCWKDLPHGNWLYVQGFGGTEETRFYRISHLAAGNTGDFLQLPCSSHGHDGWAYDKNGNEVCVFQDNTNDWFSAFNPETRERIDIMHMSETGWNFNQHMGRVYNPEKKGWLLMSSYADAPVGRHGLDQWGKAFRGGAGC